MARSIPLLLAAALGLAACAPVPVDPLQVARDCERRAQGARGPTGAVQVGASSSDGPFVGGAITLSSDYLAGRDPYEVYATCVTDRTGAPPVRPPTL